MSDPPTRRMSREPRPPGLFTLGGRYVADRQIAGGGMGTVYEGHDAVLDRPVAIKVLHVEPGAGPANTFLREARAVAALKHPNIVDVYDAGIEGDTPYIVMEYVPGRTLRNVIDAEAPLNPDQAADIAATLATALEYAHQRGIIHCDIKPGNILLPAERTPKIVDFGIAHAGSATGTLDGTIAGTAAYIAPEQLDGLPPDGRVDVYSLAAVLYEMLTGVPPFEGRTLAAVAAQRLQRPAVSPRQHNPAVSDRLAAVVLRGLAREREQRYPSAAAFATDLRGNDDGMTMQATRVRLRPAATPARDQTAVWQPDGPAAGRPATPTKPKRFPWALVAVLGAVLAGAVAAVVLLSAGVFDSISTAAVPDVINQRLDSAAERLHDAGLAVATDVQFVESRQPPGTVIDQQPAPGAVIDKSSPVRLTVSRIPQ